LFDGKKKNNFILWQSIMKDVLTSQGLDINALEDAKLEHNLEESNE
jgi:hypothetical protein